MRWTEEQLAAHLAKTGIPGPAPIIPDMSDPPFSLAPGSVNSVSRSFALGRLKTGEMNKTEAKYDAHLWLQRHAGEIVWHKFEGIKLRLADNTFLTVDFPCMRADGLLEMHEVKGHWEDDARVKIKVAASLYPFRFIAVKPRAQKHGGGWEVEEF